MAALALAAILAGCGASGGHGAGGMMGAAGRMTGSGRSGMPTSPPTGAPAPNGGGETRTGGSVLFRSSGCGGCHTLAAAGATGTAGPDLDRVHPSYALVVRLVTDGAGAMPGYADSLSAGQIRAIARYLAASAR